MQLWRWFVQNKGRETAATTKPYLTTDQKKARKEWCMRIKSLIAEHGNNFYCCFLDEKWFYTVSRRRKVKFLPPIDGEDENKIRPWKPRLVSRKNDIKVSILN